MANLNLISIIIVNWNGRKWLKDCFESLEQQTYKNFEVIFVDNSSSDDSVSFVKRYFPWVKIIQNTTNRGFAGGNSDGLKVAKGDYILLLNNDTRVEKDFLKNYLKGFRELPQAGCIQSKLILMNESNKLDLVGSYWTDSSFLYYYGFGKNVSLKKYNMAMPFFSNKGASMLIKREVIDKVGGLFDDDFWCYYEETDFCHRVWLAGYECWYWPEAVCYHAGGGTSAIFENSYIQFHNFKNKLMSFIKNFEGKTLIKIIPVYLILNVLISIAWLVQGKPKHFAALYKSIWWNFVNLRKTLKKRNQIQKLRKLEDKEIFAKVKRNPRIKYYYYLFFKVQFYED